MAEPTPKKVNERGAKRHLVGRVVSDTTKAGRASKSLTIVVIRNYRDPVYGKYVKKAKKYHVHDETEQYRMNDVIEIRECRPRSKTKRWEATKLISRPEEV